MSCFLGRATPGSRSASEARLRAVIERFPLGVHVFAPDGRSLLTNAAWDELWGPIRKEPGNIFEDHRIRDAGFVPYVEKGLGGAAVATPPLLYDPKRAGCEGGARWLRGLVHPIEDEAGRVIEAVLVIEDVTERKALEEQLEHRAFHDPLTDLPNRALFMDRLERALARLDRRQGSLAVLFLDLDDFKAVNDEFGHEVGDKLLVAASRRLRKCVRPEDTVARLGGDEFAVLLENVEGGAIQVAERIAQTLRTPFDLEERRLSVGTSIGIAFGASSQDRPGDLLRNADLAMYEAKKKGKAHYEVFDPSTGRRSLRRLGLERDLRLAVEREEFEVLYQPKVLLSTGKITGMEALVRWEHPERGSLLPSEFIPLAEETGLIVPIGYSVLEEACRQARAWRERYPDASLQTMYVNLSARQFEDPGLVEGVERALRETGVEPCGLALEIGERALMNDAESAVDRLRALRELGVRVVVDDFGTAYSSLSRLGRLPLSSLNIDRSLVFGLGAGPEHAAIVSAVINLAHALGWEVTAEGVETADQLARLRELGCDIAQGYHLWDPLTSEEASSFLADSR